MITEAVRDMEEDRLEAEREDERDRRDYMFEYEGWREDWHVLGLSGSDLDSRDDDCDDPDLDSRDDDCDDPDPYFGADWYDNWE